MCKTCGCQVFEAREVSLIVYMFTAKVNSLQPDDSESGSFGVNITLLSNIGDYFNDAQGMDTNGMQLEGKGGAVLKGLEKDDEARSRVPVYKLNL